MVHRTQCPGCGNGSSQGWIRVPYDSEPLRRYFAELGAPVDHDLLAGHHFEVVQCRGCELVYQSEVLEDRELGMLYGRGDRASQPPPSELRSLCHLAQDALLMRQLVPPGLEPPKLLDYGMGWGHFSKAAQAFGFAADGVEISEPCRKHAQQYGVALAEPDRLPTNHFDAVMIDQVLEHLADPRSVTLKLVQALKPGGILLAGTPGVRGIESRLALAGTQPNPIASLRARDLDAISPLIHVNLFNARSLRRLLESSGLQWLRPSIRAGLASGILWSSGRQWNRNLYTPLKYWLGRGTRLWFQKPSAKL